MYESIVAGGGVLTQPYGCSAYACSCQCEWQCPGRCGCGGFSFHAGIDVARAGRVQLLAAGYGRVFQIGRLGGACGGLGPYAVGIISGPLVIWYGHASWALVRPGDLVSPGQPIAWMGSLGCSSGQHVHYEIGPSGYSSGCSSIDPTPYVGSWPGSPPAGPPQPVPAPSPQGGAAPWLLAAAGAALLIYAGGS